MPGCPKCQTELPLQGDACPKCGADINWWSSRGGQVYGPYDLATVHFCRQDGRIVDDDYVRIGEGAWGLARDVLPTHAAYTAKPYPSQLVAAAPRAPSAKPNSSVYVIVAVVVGVGLFLMIAVMAAILFPVFARAREKARQTTCLSNLKQISVGLRMYANDNAERLPPGSDWGKACSLYIKPRPQGPDLWTCPSFDPPKQYVVNPDYSGKRFALPAPGTPPKPMLSCPQLSLGSGGGPHNGGYNQLFPDGQTKYVKDAQSSSP
jgi:hypothetical protein